MANEEHVKLLKAGVEGWNTWRVEHPDVRPNLRGAKLIGAKLIGADLRRSDLRRSDLRGSDLSGADLTGADFSRAKLHTRAKLSGARCRFAKLWLANLSDADLSDAHLRRANLGGANLIGANLRGAELRGADLGGARLHGADLYKAQLGDTDFVNIDLRQARGLDTVNHLSPSPVSTSTLERSHGQIPREFLKGCGLADWEIEAARLWDPELDTDQRTTIWYEVERIRSERAIHWFRVFISYTREDSTFVEALEKCFDEKGVRYWRDVHDLKAGRLDRQIDRAITMNPLVLVVLSERSVNSPWVEWEVAKAGEILRQELDAGQPARDVLCPIALDEAWKSSHWPAPLRRQVENYNVLDFSRWKNAGELDRAFAKLYEGVILNYRL